MRLTLIVNPGSGGGTDPAEVERALRAHGGEMVAADATPERLVVASGDGAIAKAAEQATALGVPLAVLPSGTANDFARAHGLTDDLDAAARVACTATATVDHDLGRIGTRPFVNVASCGLAPYAARRAEPLKKLLGPIAYAAGALAAAVRAQPIKLTADADGERVFDGRAWQVTVAVTGAFGGGSRIDAADPADRRLDLVVVPAGSRLALGRRAYGMRAGSLTEQRDVLHVCASRIELSLEAAAAFNVDGEVVSLGPRVPVELDAATFELVSGSS